MVRFAREGDLPFLKNAWKVCFEDPDAFIDWNFSHNFSYENTLIAQWEGVPASNMQMMPHTVSLRGTEYRVNYISGVATLPEFRHKGLVRDLFAQGFLEMEKRNHPFSLLVPFNYEFYEKFGYRQCYEKVYRGTDTLPERNYLTKETWSPDLIAALDSRYRAEMKSHTGFAVRTAADWQRILEDLLILSEGLVLLEEEGYALITPNPKEGWEIHELCGSVSLSYREEKKPFAMARILDPLRLLRDRAKDFDGCVRLNILDAQIPKNNICVKITHDSVVPCENYDSCLDIRELAPLLFGFTEDITQSGLFSKENPYLNMIF